MIKEIRLENFRNYEDVKVSFNEELNIFCGQNGQGKTNLLEAVYFLGMLSSFRKTESTQMVRQGKNSFSISGRFEGADAAALSVEKNHHGWKKICADGSNYKKKLDYIGKVRMVVFSPDEMELIQGSPEGRRRYLDRAYFNICHHHLKQLKIFRRILRQRNSLLKKGGFSRQEINSWSEKLAYAGARLIKGRMAMADLLNEKLDKSHPFIGKDKVSLQYMGGFSSHDEHEKIEANLLASLFKVRKEEAHRRITLAGPHRDDIAIRVNGVIAKSFSSRGEMRSVLLALKTAETEVYRSVWGENPLTLLDDVASELDIERRKALLSFLRQKGEQVLITTTEVENIPFERSSKDTLFMVSKGKILH